MEIMILGSGGSLPTRNRHPSSTALIRDGELWLFDCGEGTQMRFQQAGLRPGKLNKIFVSHFHGDHIYGLPGLLTSLQLNDRKKSLQLFGGKGLKQYVESVCEFSYCHLDYEILVEEIEETAAERTWDFGRCTLTTRPLDHRVFVLGFRIEEKPKPGKFDVEMAERLGIPFGPLRRQLQMGQPVTLPDGQVVRPEQVLGPPRPGKKVAICLDTRPCENAVQLARNVDLLVHDGTFDATQSEWANTTGHSTVEQAAQVAAQAGAKKLVLTHISARYKESDEKRLLEQARKIFPNTLLGHDLMKISV